MPRPDPGPFAYIDLPLTFVGIALFSAKEGHGFFVFYILWTIYDGNNFSFRAEGLTDTHSLGNVIEIAFRRIPVTPDLNPNFVVRHGTSLRAGVFFAIFTPSSPMRLSSFGPSTNSRHLRVVCARDRYWPKV
jgi:hypothetical protein